MRDIPPTPADLLDLRGLRESLVPRPSLREVACGAGIETALLSRIETGRKEISLLLARRLARFYSRATGRSVTAGEIFDRAELALNRRRAG
jgi:transcriptional regulator with XRE-family HTH domain